MRRPDIGARLSNRRDAADANEVQSLSRLLLATIVTIAAAFLAAAPAALARHAGDATHHGGATHRGSASPDRATDRRSVSHPVRAADARRLDERRARRSAKLALRTLRRLAAAASGVHAREANLSAAAERTLAVSGEEACAGEDLMPEARDLEAIRAATFCLINRERASHGVRPLLFNSKLQRAAQGHSTNMVLDDYFSHYGPNGATPSARIRAAGYIYSESLGYEVGENIAWGTLSLATPKSIVEAWMQSPGHRENILDRHYREAGIGVVAQVPSTFAEGEAGAIYTQDFGVLIAP